MSVELLKKVYENVKNAIKQKSSNKTKKLNLTNAISNLEIIIKEAETQEKKQIQIEEEPSVELINEPIINEPIINDDEPLLEPMLSAQKKNEEVPLSQTEEENKQIEIPIPIEEVEEVEEVKKEIDHIEPEPIEPEPIEIHHQQKVENKHYIELLDEIKKVDIALSREEEKNTSSAPYNESLPESPPETDTIEIPEAETRR